MTPLLMYIDCADRCLPAAILESNPPRRRSRKSLRHGQNVQGQLAQVDEVHPSHQRRIGARKSRQPRERRLTGEKGQGGRHEKGKSIHETQKARVVNESRPTSLERPLRARRAAASSPRKPQRRTLRLGSSAPLNASQHREQKRRPAMNPCRALLLGVAHVQQRQRLILIPELIAAVHRDGDDDGISLPQTVATRFWCAISAAIAMSRGPGGPVQPGRIRRPASLLGGGLERRLVVLCSDLVLLLSGTWSC